jgi:hypothetical protein
MHNGHIARWGLGVSPSAGQPCPSRVLWYSELMKAEILGQLARPYHEALSERGGFAIAIGAAVPGVQTLVREILDDLDEQAGGVGWWSPYPDRDRRILISDHLVECVSTIETNFQEARLHLWELEDFDAQISEQISRAVSADRQGRFAGMHLPRMESPLEDLPNAMSELHAAGFARAIGSVLDCMASAIVGIVGLPLNILTADLGRLVKKYDHGKPFPGPAWSSSFHSILHQQLQAVGPPGWYAWALGFRNMLVHRARRTRLFKVVPRQIPLVDQHDFPIVLSHAVRLLPREPALSDVETLRSDQSMLDVLTEHESVTLGGIFESTRALVEVVGRELLSIWKARRFEPDAVQQPTAQWPSVPSGSPCGFAGYAPGSEVVTPDRLHMHPDAVRRIRAAGLAKKT